MPPKLFPSSRPRRNGHRDHIVLLAHALFPSCDAVLALKIRLFRGLLLRHDYSAFQRRYRLRFGLKGLAPVRFVACRIYLSMCRRYYILKRYILYGRPNKCRGYVHLLVCKGSLQDPALLHETQLRGSAPRPSRYRGGGRRVSLFPHELLKDYIIRPTTESCLIDMQPSARYKYVDHVGDVDLLQYPPELYVHVSLPLGRLLYLLPTGQAQKIARLHELKFAARADSAALSAMAEGHDCLQCTTHVSVFSKEASKAEVSNARLRKHRQMKQQIPAPSAEDFPPSPLSSALRDTIITSACKKMSPDKFEEGGCAVCGELKPSHELSRLKSIKNQLQVLCAAGVTRVERKKNADPIREFTGPVLDYNCNRVCDSCRASLRKGKVPRLALANGLWLGNVPTELKSLRFVEKMLVARVRHTCAYVKVASGMRKMKANIVAFESPTPKVYDMLPPPREDMDDVLAILFTGPCKPTPEDFKRTPLLIRRNHVIRALEWLKLNHSDYADIEISRRNMEEYSEDSPPVSIEYRAAETNKVPEGTSVFDTAEEDGTDEGECPYTVHGLMGEDLDAMPPSVIKATALRHLNSGGKVLAVGHAGKPETMYNNPQLYPQMFPWLFPYGHGGIASGASGLSDKAHKHHLLMYHDKRFQTDVDFPFVAFSHEQMKASTTQSFLLADQARFSDISERLMNIDWTTMESLAKRMESGEHVKPNTEDEQGCFQIVNDLDAMSGKVHGSLASKKQMRNEIWALISRLGAPYWYITLSPADNRHPISIYFAGSDEKFSPIPLSYAEKTRLICRNPVAGARFFHFLVESFIEDVLGFKSSHRGAYGNTSAYYGTVEQQGRLSLHLHLLLWVKGTLTPQEMRDKLTGDDSAWAKKLIAWLESCHTGDFLMGAREDVVEKTKQRDKDDGYVDPTESLPVPPPPVCSEKHANIDDGCHACALYRDWERTFHDTVDDILLRSNVHSCQRGVNKDGSRKKSMASAGCMDNKWRKCKACFPRETHPRTFVDKLGAVIMKKVEPWLNTFTPLVTYIFRCNTDVTSLASGTAIKAVVMYVSDYITKSTLKTHTIFDSIRAVFHKNSEMIGGTLPMKEKARRFMTKIVNILSAKAEMGAPMISMYLLGNPDHYTSHVFVPFYWQNYVSEVRHAFDDQEHQAMQKVTVVRTQGRIVGLSPVHDYVHRPPHLQDVNLYEWVRCYERVKFPTKKNARPVDDRDLADDDDGRELSGFPSAADIEETGESVVQPAGKNVFQFGAEHPLHKTHGMRCIDKSELRVPNFLGATLPRCDKGDREYYCCTMLTLFKPWRKGTDLRSPDCSWDETYNAHVFAESEGLLIKNFNIRYECMDARDDYRAQLKKGAAPNIFSSWDSASAEGTEQPISDFLPDADQSLDETNEDVLVSGPLHKRKLRELETARAVFSLSGWSSPCILSESSCAHASIQPTKTMSGTAWGEVVDKYKQDVLAKKNEHNSVCKSLQSESDPSAQSFRPDVVKIIDKSYLHRSFVRAGHSECVSDTVSHFSLNAEQERAFRIIANHAISPHPEQLRMNLGGMGGTGKTQVLKALAHFFKERNEAHRFVVVAPTGTAAALLGGSTYHYMFGINERMNQNKVGVIKARLTGVDYIFFDEVSMLSARDLYKINNQLAKVMGNADLPFGGLNMVFSGDFAQLPPAIGGENVSLYSRTIGAVASDRKSQEEAIGKALWHQITTVVILCQNMRQRTQSADDAKLRTALENMRYKSCTPEDISFLRTRISSTVPGKPSICDKEFRNVSIITGTNLHKDEINRLGSIRFAHETNQGLTTFFSEDSEKANPKEDKGRGVLYMKQMSDSTQSVLWNEPPSFTDKHIPGKLSLCIGMPIMIRYNYATELCMTRGQEGYVAGWQGKRGSRNQQVLDVLFVELKEPPSKVNFEGLPENVVPVYPTTNTIQVMLPCGNKYYIVRKQVEVLPNFAMTDFASQGKTRKHNVADLYNLSTHQAYYTALSRSASAAGTLIVQGFDSRKIVGGCSGVLRQEFRELEILDSITTLMHEEKLPAKVYGVTRNELIRTFRQWKGLQFIPKTVHRAIRWSKRDPLIESAILDLVGWNNSDGTQTEGKPPVKVEVVPLACKRKLSESDLSGASDVCKKKRMDKDLDDNLNHVVSHGTPGGFTWESNSCAYDSVFTVLLQLWMADSDHWEAVARSIDNQFLIALFAGLGDATISLEHTRDTVRRMLHAYDPSQMRFGRYTAVDTVLSAILASCRPTYRSYYVCGSGHRHVAHEFRTLHQSAGVNSYQSTSEWLTSHAVETVTNRPCFACDGGTSLIGCSYVETPPLIALEWSGLEICIDDSVSIRAPDGSTKEYRLKGIIYFGDGHFVSVVALRGGQLWFYDGMKHGGTMQYIGSLRANPPDLSRQDGKLAVAGIYAPSQHD